MPGPLHDTVTTTARRADYGQVRLGRRDIDGLILCAEQSGAPYDLLAAALGAQPARLRGITARWRRAGFAATGRLGPGPAWCWLTPGGMAAAGLGYPATRPALARLAHIRAVLAARLWLQAAPGRPSRPGPRPGRPAARPAVPDRDPGPAPVRIHPRREPVMTVTSWLRLTISLWLLRKAVKGAGWLVLFLLLAAVWPVTLVAVAGYLAARGRGWPPARLGRAAAATLALTGIYAAGEVVRQHVGRAAALAPVQAWAHGWHRDALAVARMFVQVSPVAVPAGLALAAGLWSWRNYAISAGIGGRMASAPATFDNRQWRRQVSAAKGRTAAPGLVPLLTRKGSIPVGGTIRAIGCPWQPVFTLPAAACARHHGDRRRDRAAGRRT